jgi:hypothetical protein
MRPTRLRASCLRVGALLVCLLPLGCGDAPTSVELVLTTNPDLCRPEEVLAAVATVAVVVDAPGGLVGVTAPGPLSGGGTAVDFDGDGELEVVFTAPPLTGPTLPILEVGLRHNAGRELAYRVLGFPAGATVEPANAVAFGGVSATCAPGEVQRVGTPFNLRAVARPPQVVLVLPPDGAADVPVSLRSVTIMFSTTLAPDGVAGAIHLLDSDGVPVAATASVATLTYAVEAGLTEQRSLVTLELDQGIAPPLGPDPATFTVAVDATVVSTAGRSFDQDPATAVADGFTSHFQVRGEVGGGQPCDLCPTGYGCDEAGTGCLPLLDCSGGCGPGFVCAAAADLCVEDCRLYGLCAAAGAQCEAETGLCR